MSSALRSGGVALAALFALGLAGCSGQNAQSELPQKNEAQWTLPLDQYQSPLVDTVIDAEQLLIQSCMQDAGFNWSVLVTSVDGRPGESWNPVHRKLFNADLAEKYGYSNSHELALSTDDAQRWADYEEANRTVGGSAQGQVTKCMGSARRQIGETGTRSPYDLAEQLANVAFADARDVPSVKEADSAWQKCMASAGVPDLPNSPMEMPSASVSALRPSVDGAVGPDGTVSVPDEERRVAVADAKCRETTGYSKSLYDAEWEAQVNVMQDRGDDLERYASEAKKRLQAATQIVANNAPRNR